MMIRCMVDHEEQSSVIFLSKYKIFKSAVWETAILFGPQFVKLVINVLVLECLSAQTFPAGLSVTIINIMLW